MARLDALALGSNVALSSLVNIVNDLMQVNRRGAGQPVRALDISSTPISFFPNVERTEDGYEYSSGPVATELVIVMYAAAYQRLSSVWYAGGTVKSRAMTLYTYVTQRDAYARFNCIGHYPDGQDVEQIRGHLLRVHWRFTDLVAST